MTLRLTDREPFIALVAALAALAEQLAELGRLGVTSNRHTSYNMAGLRGVHTNLGNFVKNRLSALHEEKRLRDEYEAAAAASRTWLEAATTRLGELERKNTLADAIELIAAFSTFKTTEKTAQANALFSLEKLREALTALLTAQGRPEYVPPAGLHVDTDLKATLWTGLEAAETARAMALRNYLEAQEQLTMRVKQFEADVVDVRAWLDGQTPYVEALTGEGGQATALQAAQFELVKFETFSDELATRKQRLADIDTALGDIRARKYGEQERVDGLLAALQAAFASVEEKAALKKTALDGELAEQRRIEDARVAYSAAVRALENDARLAEEEVSLFDTGFTLAGVEAAGEPLQAKLASVRAALATRRAAFDAVAATLADAKTDAKPHSSTTTADVDGVCARVEAALAARAAAYEEQLALHRQHDKLRRDFADAAKAVVAFVDQARDELRHSTTADAVDAVAARVAADGAAAMTAARTANSACVDESVVGNDYTSMTLAFVEERFELLRVIEAAVRAHIAEVADFNARAADVAATSLKIREAEAAQFEYLKRAKRLINWIDGMVASVSEPVAATSLEALDAADAATADAAKAIEEKRGEYTSTVRLRKASAAAGASVKELKMRKMRVVGELGKAKAAEKSTPDGEFAGLRGARDR